MTLCKLENLFTWFETEAHSLPDSAYTQVILDVNRDLDSFVKWPQRAELLWAGCDRSTKYHSYPMSLISLLKERGTRADTRSNGPAITAFLAAGGERPKRNGRHDWTIHHLYDGRFPYPTVKRSPLHAARNSDHFTQSAGLVAIHPIADALAGEFAIFAWRLRAEAFVRFGYDPEGAFAERVDEYGFVRDGLKVWHSTGKSL